MFQLPLDTPPWPCIQAFKRRDYERCIAEAQRSMSGAVKPVELFLLLLSLPRAGRPAEAEQLAPQMIDGLRDVPFEQDLVRLIMGEISGDQILAKASTSLQKWQATFYAGAKAITEGNSDEARKQARAYLHLIKEGEFPECYEFLLAPPEFERFVPAGVEWPTPSENFAGDTPSESLAADTPPSAPSIWDNLLVRDRNVTTFDLRGRQAFAPIGALCGLAISVSVAFFMPLQSGPVPLLLFIFLAPFASFFFVISFSYFVQLFSGHSLTCFGMLAACGVFIAAAAVVNSSAVDPHWNQLKEQLAKPNDANSEFAADDELKGALLKLVQEASRNSSRTFFVQFKEEHDSTLPPEAIQDLKIWEADEGLRPDTPKRNAPATGPIPGSKPELKDIGVSQLLHQWQDALNKFHPTRSVTLKEIKDDQVSKIELQATTRLEGTFGKIKLGTYPNSPVQLMIGMRIDWAVRALDSAGTVLYSKNFVSRPAKHLEWKGSLYGGADDAVYKYSQYSAQDNFAREFLGRVGLPIWPEKTDWSKVP